MKPHAAGTFLIGYVTFLAKNYFHDTQGIILKHFSTVSTSVILGCRKMKITLYILCPSIA